MTTLTRRPRSDGTITPERLSTDAPAVKVVPQIAAQPPHVVPQHLLESPPEIIGDRRLPGIDLSHEHSGLQLCPEPRCEIPDRPEAGKPPDGPQQPPRHPSVRRPVEFTLDVRGD